MLVRATVAAPPESDDWLKLPSGEVSVQLVTPFVLQKIEVRAPSGTEAGTAQMSTFGVTAGVVVAAGAGTVGVGCFRTGVCWRTGFCGTGAGGGGGGPTG